MENVAFRFIADAPDFNYISKNSVRAYGVDWIRIVYDIDRARGDFYSMWQSKNCGTMPKVRVEIFDQIPYWGTEKVYFENVRIFEQKITKTEGSGINNPPSIAAIRSALLACKSKQGIFKMLKSHLGAHLSKGIDPANWFEE